MKSKKLSLTTETLRLLNAGESLHVAGGVTLTNCPDCPETVGAACSTHPTQPANICTQSGSPNC